MSECRCLPVAKERRAGSIKALEAFQILSRALSNRLKEYRSERLRSRTIMHNVFILRHVIDICRVSNFNISMVSTKKLDRINHKYLVSVFQVFGVWRVFRHCGTNSSIILLVIVVPIKEPGC